MSNFSLQDKTVIVTGGAGGLGRPMCATFAAAGANVIVASRSRDKIEAEGLLWFTAKCLRTTRGATNRSLSPCGLCE